MFNIAVIGSLIEAAGFIGILSATYLKGLKQKELEDQKNLEKIRDFEAQKKLVELYKRLGHDIRSPISALNMLPVEKSNFEKKYINLFKQATNRINGIANDLLIRSKELDLKDVHATCLKAIIKDIVAEKSFELQNRKLTISFSCELSEAKAMVSKVEFGRVISNLLNNSASAILQSNTQGLIHIKLSSVDGNLVLKIKDNGCGIAKEQLDLLNRGEPFTKTIRPNIKPGFGIGASSAFEIIKKYKGKVEYSSELNRGTTVIIRLPNISNNI